MRRSLAAILFLCACTTATPPRSSSAELARIAGDYWKHQLAQDVGLQIKFGIPTEHLPDPSFAHAQAEAEYARTMLSDLARINPAELTEDERITMRILQWQSELAIESLQHFWLQSFITPYATPIRTINQVFTEENLTPERRAKLIDEYGRYLDAMTAIVNEQRRRGILIPRSELPAVRAVIDAIPVQKPAAERLLAAIGPAYEAAAPADVGLGQYPGGAGAYRFFIKTQTSLALSPEEIHQLGLREVARINSELDAIRQQVGFNGTLVEFRQYLKTDPRFFATSADEIGTRLTTYIRRIEPHIPQYFAKTPRAAYDVKRLDPNLEGSMTFGFYQQPRANDAVGHYFYNGSKVNERNLLFAPALMLHELIPGHHFQIARQEENTALPEFRRESFDNAFVEGWGEYSAALGSDMGMYDDPYDHAGRLMMDSLLSVRLVVDTGMNALGWSRQRAMQYMRENTFQSETEIGTESLRYSVDIPAQALGYKLGALKMIELREKAKRALGPRFDIREFHEWVIGSGSMPLTVLDEHVKAMAH